MTRSGQFRRIQRQWRVRLTPSPFNVGAEVAITVAAAGAIWLSRPGWAQDVLFALLDYAVLTAAGGSIWLIFSRVARARRGLAVAAHARDDGQWHQSGTLWIHCDHVRVFHLIPLTVVLTRDAAETAAAGEPQVATEYDISPLDGGVTVTPIPYTREPDGQVSILVTPATSVWELYKRTARAGRLRRETGLGWATVPEIIILTGRIRTAGRKG